MNVFVSCRQPNGWTDHDQIWHACVDRPENGHDSQTTKNWPHVWAGKGVITGPISEMDTYMSHHSVWPRPFWVGAPPSPPNGTPTCPGLISQRRALISKRLALICPGQWAPSSYVQRLCVGRRCLLKFYQHIPEATLGLSRTIRSRTKIIKLTPGSCFVVSPAGNPTDHQAQFPGIQLNRGVFSIQRLITVQGSSLWRSVHQSQ